MCPVCVCVGSQANGQAASQPQQQTRTQQQPLQQGRPMPRSLATSAPATASPSWRPHAQHSAPLLSASSAGHPWVPASHANLGSSQSPGYTPQSPHYRPQSPHHTPQSPHYLPPLPPSATVGMANSYICTTPQMRGLQAWQYHADNCTTSSGTVVDNQLSSHAGEALDAWPSSIHQCSAVAAPPQVWQWVHGWEQPAILQQPTTEPGTVPFLPTPLPLPDSHPRKVLS